MTRIVLNRPSALIRLAIAAGIATGLPAGAMPDLSQPEPKPFTDADREAIERAQQKRARKAARRLATTKES